MKIKGKVILKRSNTTGQSELKEQILNILILVKQLQNQDLTFTESKYKSINIHNNDSKKQIRLCNFKFRQIIKSKYLYLRNED